jgi:hypothetical protein
MAEFKTYHVYISSGPFAASDDFVAVSPLHAQLHANTLWKNPGRLDENGNITNIAVHLKSECRAKGCLA